MSAQSSSSHAVVACHCGTPCHMYTLHRECGYARTFYRCPQNHTPIDCNFLKWHVDSDKVSFDGGQLWRNREAISLSQRISNLE